MWNEREKKEEMNKEIKKKNKEKEGTTFVNICESGAGALAFFYCVRFACFVFRVFCVVFCILIERPCLFITPVFVMFL